MHIVIYRNNGLLEEVIADLPGVEVTLLDIGKDRHDEHEPLVTLPSGETALHQEVFVHVNAQHVHDLLNVIRAQAAAATPHPAGMLPVSLEDALNMQRHSERAPDAAELIALLQTLHPDADALQYRDRPRDILAAVTILSADGTALLTLDDSNPEDAAIITTHFHAWNPARLNLFAPGDLPTDETGWLLRQRLR